MLWLLLFGLVCLVLAGIILAVIFSDDEEGGRLPR